MDAEEGQGQGQGYFIPNRPNLQHDVEVNEPGFHRRSPTADINNLRISSSPDEMVDVALSFG